MALRCRERAPSTTSDSDLSHVCDTTAVGTRVTSRPRPDPYVPNSGIRLPPWVDDGETLILRLTVCAPASVTRLSGSVPAPCFAGSHSPRPPPFAPPAPLRPSSLCSSASPLLWQSLTSRDRTSSATAPRLPDADRRLLPNGRSRDLPVPAQGASAHARVSDYAGSSGPRGVAPGHVAFHHLHGVGTHTMWVKMRK